MAFKKLLAQRLFNSHKFTAPSLTTTCRISSSSMTSTKSPPPPDKIAQDPGDNGMFRRFLHRRSMHQSPATSPGLRSLPTCEKLFEKLRAMDIARGRIRLDGLVPPPPQHAPADSESEMVAEGKFTVADARKILRISQLEVVKMKLREHEKSCVSYSEFLQICSDQACVNGDQALDFAKMLDDSGTVIVLGNVVFLRPDQVVKAIRGLMPNTNETRMMKELEQMEEQKAIIDKKAESLVRRELWCGLGFLVIQTSAFMRLTFWELSWDVMEPICFYVTSIYCMIGYGFFLRTSKEPSFEGFFQSRFSAKQKKLMKLHKFDFRRYNELRRACYPQSSSSPPENTLSFNSLSNLHEHITR